MSDGEREAEHPVWGPVRTGCAPVAGSLDPETKAAEERVLVAP